MIVSLILLLIGSLFRKYSSLNKSSAYILLLLVVFWVYILFQSMFLDNINYAFIIKSFLLSFITILPYSFILSNNEIKYKFFKNFIRLQIFLSFSYLTTMLLIYFLPAFDFRIFEFDFGYSSLGSVYFPLTPISSVQNILNLQLLRFSSIFREPGIAQAFLIWSYFSLEKFDLNRNRNYFLLLVGILGTFSSIAIPLFFVVFALKYLLTARIELIQRIGKYVIIIGIAIYVSIYFPYIGLNSKILTHGESFFYRFNVFLNFNVDEYFLFGRGFSNTLLAGDNINLFTATNAIGMIGFIIVILIYVYPTVMSKDRKDNIIKIMPFLLTVLIAQPIYIDPLILIFLGSVSSSNVRNFRLKGH